MTRKKSLPEPGSAAGFRDGRPQPPRMALANPWNQWNQWIFLSPAFFQSRFHKNRFVWK
jgi:hypothetical protein